MGGVMDLQLAMSSVPIATNVVSSNPAHGEVYSMQHYVKRFVINLRQVCGFLDIASCKSMTPPSTTLVTSWRPVLLLDKITDLLQISVKLYKKKLVSSTPQHRTLWVRIPLMARCTLYNIMWKGLSLTCGRSVVFSRYSGFLHQLNWLPRYNWHIVKHLITLTLLGHLKQLNIISSNNSWKLLCPNMLIMV
jgi:hypothetical protein